MLNQPSAYASVVPGVRPTVSLAMEPGTAVVCRRAAQFPECESPVDTEAFPVPAAEMPKPSRVPASKLDAAAWIPGYGSLSASVEGTQACAPAVSGPRLSAGRPRIANTSEPARHSLTTRFISRPSTIGPCHRRRPDSGTNGLGFR